MKCTILLFFLALLVFQTPTYGQPVRFTDPSNVWHIHYMYQEPTFQTESDGFYFYPDTVMLNGYVYYRLSENAYSFSTTPAWLDSALIREDTNLNRVYARIYKNGGYTGDTSEVILYDFSLQQGDTFTMTTPLDTYQHIVSAVSNISVNGVMHKQWHFQAINTNNQNYAVVEGIGCLGEPLGPYRPSLPFSASWWLICFRNATVGVWSSATWSTCLLGIADAPTNIDQIAVYPTPASNEVSIKLSDKTFGKESTILAFDCLGRKVLETYPKLNERIVHLNTTSWSPGIYNILVRYSNTTFYSKKIAIEK